MNIYGKEHITELLENSLPPASKNAIKQQYEDILRCYSRIRPNFDMLTPALNPLPLCNNLYAADTYDISSSPKSVSPFDSKE